VECAIALDFSGQPSEASLAYKWMRDIQNPDGSWYFSYLNDKPQDLTKDTNFSTYIATGMWFHYASSSTWLSIKCGIRIAKNLGIDKPDWNKACQKLTRAIKEHPERFDRLGEDKSGHAMTWYYPILVGLLKGKQAEERISRGWQDFIIDGWGCKCFADRQSVCVAETFEFILALIRMGASDKAKTVLDWVLQFRDSDGVFYREVYWPQREIRRPEREPQVHEKNTWTSAAAILAMVALGGIKIP